MKTTRVIMGMPITVEILGVDNEHALVEEVFLYFQSIDKQFSPFLETSEVSRINAGTLAAEDSSAAMQEVLRLSEQTKQETNGYFDVYHNRIFNPSGLVKGWSISTAAKLLRSRNCINFCVEAGGDLEVSGMNAEGTPWRAGIRNPFQFDEIVKVVELHDQGMATSGSYLQGKHIYNPHDDADPLDAIVSLTVIGPTAYDADRFATAAFAMGKKGIQFVEQLPEHEGYVIDTQGTATMTSNFHQYTTRNEMD